MGTRQFGPGLLLLFWLYGCAGPGGLASGDTLQVGQREETLLALRGQPQEVQPAPGGGKIYIYTSYGIEQTAVMGGGAWNRPDQVYYWLNDQGVITRVARYPYGKRKFLFPTHEKAEGGGQATAALPSQPTATVAPPAESPAVKAPPPMTEPAVSAPLPPPSSSPMAPAAKPSTPEPPGKGKMEAAARLELNMTRQEVQALLGPPERTEGFRAQGRPLIVWFYLLEGPQGRRVLTPLVFEDSRLSGWGEDFYKRRLRSLSGESP